MLREVYRRSARLGVLLGAVALGCLVGSLWVGPAGIPPGETLAALTGGGSDPAAGAIVLGIRLPRAALAFSSGAMLAVGGAVVQSLIRNPLAEPYLLGLSGGAALGALIGGIVLPGLPGAPAGLAFLFALLSAGAVVRLSARNGFESWAVILYGLLLNFLFSAVIILLLTLRPANDTHTAFFWLAGGLGRTGGAAAWWSSAASLLLAAGLLPFASRLNALALGDDFARQAGIDVRRLRLAAYGLTALGTAVVVSAAGIIGFAGVMVPAAARLLVGGDHRPLLVVSLFGGGILLLLADATARVVLSPAEVPIGVVTAFIGVPVLFLLMRRGVGR